MPIQPAEPQAELVPVEAASEKPLEEFLIEDLGPDEEEDMPQKVLSLIQVFGEMALHFSVVVSLITGLFICKIKHFIY